MTAVEMFTVVGRSHRGFAAGVEGETDLEGFAVLGPDGVEVDWLFGGMGDAALKLAARLNEMYADREIVRCKTCGAVVTANDPDRFPYCKRCFYVGNAHTDIRRVQVARFARAFPGWDVGVDHTGGGCFWLSVRQRTGGLYFVLTNGEAGLPEDEDGNPVEGGWGYVGRYHDDEEHPDYGGASPFYFNLDALDDPDAGLSDAQAIDLIRKEMDRFDRATAAYEKVYEGAWGLKASEEDALLAVINATYPEFPTGSDGIYALRDVQPLVDLAAWLWDHAVEAGSARSIVEALLPRLDKVMSSDTVDAR